MLFPAPMKPIRQMRFVDLDGLFIVVVFGEVGEVGLEVLLDFFD